MEKNQNKLEKFISHVKEYAETRADIVALNIQDKLSDISSSIVSAILIGSLLMVTTLFFSIGIAWWVGHILGNFSLGCFCVAGFYMFIGILIYCFRNQWIKLPVINFLLKKINRNEKD